MWQDDESDLRSPLFSHREGKTLVHKSYDEVRNEFDSVYKEAVSGLPTNIRDLFDSMEEGQRKKIGPKSSHVGWPKDGPKKVDKLFSPKSTGEGFDMRIWLSAVEWIHSLIAPGSVSRMSLDQAIKGSGESFGAIDAEGMDISTNSGLNYVVSPWAPKEGLSAKKRVDVEAAYREIIQTASDLIKDHDRFKIFKWRAIVGQRKASVGTDWKDLEGAGSKKKRLIIAIEKTEPVLWKTFTPNIYDALRKVTINGVKPFMAWIDLPVIDKNCQVMLTNSSKVGEWVVSGDVSSFDQSVNPELLEPLGPVIDSWLRGSTKLGSSLVSSMSQDLSLVTPDRIIYRRSIGMPSGSGGTNLMDTLYNLAILKYGELKGYYSIHNLAAQGDDFLILGRGVDKDVIARTYVEVGMEAHEDKQMFHKDALNYLQRLHIHGWLGGIASAYRTLGSTLTYERLAFKANEWNAFVDIVRNLSQLENTAFHPAFEGLVHFVASGDKYSLGSEYPPEQVMRMAGTTGKRVVAQDQAQAWKSGHGSEGFGKMAVNGVLRGEELPPLGSRERFSRVYAERSLRE